ncbi:hypothetical protein H6P81_000060 [Aristolochia fimbriata]|uniref:Uncharacterized protein n=1 Tax=Aristolochia fimbriata TaxID=158543 RepID=A0AAV7F6Z1_ARIFI|nr:hypothetical protein H6P81_000060 [Aristolochia fimbriata]
MEEEDGVRARSFRYEDYNNRRIFLRSYPLHWRGGGEEDEEENEEEGDHQGKRGGVKGRLLGVIKRSGGKGMVLRRLKNKVTFYLVACRPFRFKPTNSLLSAGV